MPQAVEMANRWTVFDTANLRLGQIEPPSNDFLRYSVFAIKGNVVWVLPVSAGHPPDVLVDESITELL